MSKVLIVEDDKYLCRMYERAFALNGHQVECIMDGQKALDRLKEYENKPDVILLDVMVPTVNGIDILRNIKNDPNIKDIPVAVLTNSLNKENEELMISLGADLYIIKIENDIDEVLRKINKLLNK